MARKNRRKKRYRLGKNIRLVSIIFILFLLLSSFFKSPDKVFEGVEARIKETETKAKVNDKNKDVLIAIDPGHGGIDGGAIGVNGALEKDINLEISKKLFVALREKNYKVITTREKDEFIKHSRRVNIANENDVDLFVSIHCNSLENNSSVEGVQVLYYPSSSTHENGLNNEGLAGIFMESIIKETKAENGGVVPRGDVYVIARTHMPALLIETGFITNEKEENLLLTDQYQDKFVNAIVKGIEEYFNYGKNN